MISIDQEIVVSGEFKREPSNSRRHGKGNVYVAANGFNPHETTTVDGNIEFASEAVKATAKIDGKVSGTIQ